MKVLIVSESDARWGAARAAYRLHSALALSGVDSSMSVRRKQTDDPLVVGDPPAAALASRVRRFTEARLRRLHRDHATTVRSINALPTSWSRRIHSARADVVNVHWIGAGAMSIADLGRIQDPLVMTLHDMWAFCGAEHYAPESADARWRAGYLQDNRQPHRRGPDIDRWTWRRKQRRWKPAAIVTPSRWLAGLARESALLQGWPVSVVPNPIDTDLFCPRDKMEARRAWGLPDNATIILFGAIGGAQDPRKGFDLLSAGLAQVETRGKELLGVVFGEDEPGSTPRTPFPLRWLGHVEDDNRLALLYSAADVMVMPSRQEVVGQTGTEAQSCGTPVVTFDATGSAEVVDHLSTGYLAKAFSSEDLARGIDWILDEPDRRQDLGIEARRRAMELWSPAVVAAQYLCVYEEIAPESAE